MPTLELTTNIDAPRDRVFDLSRSIDLHADSMSHSREYPVAGVTSGLICEGQSVTWRAHHFGIWFSLTSLIVSVDRPNHFRDSMVRGPFRRFDHDHHFEVDGTRTVMRDVFDYTSPLGPIGRLVDRAFLSRYMKNLLLRRNAVVKGVAETAKWRQYLADRSSTLDAGVA